MQEDSSYIYNILDKDLLEAESWLESPVVLDKLHKHARTTI